MWSQMFQYEYGFINALIRVLWAGRTPTWLGSPLSHSATPNHRCSYATTLCHLIHFASLQTIPFSVIEAAAIDGVDILRL